MVGHDGVFLFPTHPTAAPFHHEPLIKPLNFAYTSAINILGLPSTACPLGLNREGLPIGIQVKKITFIIFNAQVCQFNARK